MGIILSRIRIRYYKRTIIYFLVFIRIGHAGGCFLKRCGDRIIGVHIHTLAYTFTAHSHTHTQTNTHTHNGFTPDTRRVVGRTGPTWREVSVRSTGFHYPWTGRRQPGGTSAAGGIQREIRLAPAEPSARLVQATTAIVTCTTSPLVDINQRSTMPSEYRTRVTAALGFPGKRWLALATHRLLFYHTNSTYSLNTCTIKPIILTQLFCIPPPFDLRSRNALTLVLEPLLCASCLADLCTTFVSRWLFRCNDCLYIIHIYIERVWDLS